MKTRSVSILRLLADGSEVALVSTPDTVLVAQPAREVVAVVDIPFVAPADEVPEARSVGIDRRSSEFGFPVGQVQFDCGLWFDRFEVHSWVVDEPHEDDGTGALVLSANAANPDVGFDIW